MTPWSMDDGGSDGGPRSHWEQPASGGGCLRGFAILMIGLALLVGILLVLMLLTVMRMNGDPAFDGALVVLPLTLGRQVHRA